MSTIGSRLRSSRLCWFALGMASAGCFDPLVEDPGFDGAPADPGVMPLPVGPGVAPGAGLGGSTSTASNSGMPIAETAPSPSATAAATSTGASGAETLLPSDGVSPVSPTETDDVTADQQGATGSGPGVLDAGVVDEPDAADAGPDAAALGTSGDSTGSTEATTGAVTWHTGALYSGPPGSSP
jgi:hypothetical protein